MKITRVSLLLLAGLLFSQCGNEQVAPKPDYDQISREVMTRLAPQLPGTWKMRRVHVQARAPNWPFQALAGIRRDTVLQDFAVLTIRPAAVPSTTPPNPRYPDFEGDLTFRGKDYPVRFDSRATDERVVTGQGPHAFLGLRFNSAPGSYPPNAEREYLQNIGLIDDNFSLEMLAGEKDMLWRGLSRGVVKIELQKQ